MLSESGKGTMTGAGTTNPWAVSGRRVLSDGVYDALQELVFDQRIAPGAKLNIDTLARELGVSQTPVREALARLDAEGLIIKEPLRGYAVKPMLNAQSLEQLYETRLILEPQAARLAATRASDSQIDQMERLDEALQQASTGATYREFKTFAGYDAAFHRVVAEATANDYLEEAIARLRGHLQLSRLYFRRGIVDALQTVLEHRDVVEALRRRDPAGAERWMHEHISRSRSRYEKLLAGEP